MQTRLEKLEPARLDGSAAGAKDPAPRAVLDRVDRTGCCREGVSGLTGQRLLSQSHGRTLRIQGRGQVGIRCPTDSETPGPLWEKGLQLRWRGWHCLWSGLSALMWPRRCNQGLTPPEGGIHAAGELHPPYGNEGTSPDSARAQGGP